MASKTVIRSIQLDKPAIEWSTCLSSRITSFNFENREIHGIILNYVPFEYSKKTSVVEQQTCNVHASKEGSLNIEIRLSEGSNLTDSFFRNPRVV